MSNEYIAVVDDILDAEETEKPFGKRWGNQLIHLNPAHLDALQQGKLLALDAQGEYVIYLQLEKEGHV